MPPAIKKERKWRGKMGIYKFIIHSSAHLMYSVSCFSYFLLLLLEFAWANFYGKGDIAPRLWQWSCHLSCQIGKVYGIIMFDIFIWYMVHICLLLLSYIMSAMFGGNLLRCWKWCAVLLFSSTLGAWMVQLGSGWLIKDEVIKDN